MSETSKEIGTSKTEPHGFGVQRLVILPCPFCNAEARLFKPGPFKWTIIHTCSAIKVAIKPGAKTDVIRLWNNRPAPWMPINSAPKDGSIFIIQTDTRGERDVYEAKWDENQNEFTSRNGYLIFDTAIKWMPFPEPI